MGKHQIRHPDGYLISMSICNGLPYMDLHPPSDHEMEAHPHVIFTSDVTWDPAILDHEFTVHDIDSGTEDASIPSFVSSMDRISPSGIAKEFSTAPFVQKTVPKLPAPYWIIS
jgi:hypothetical protein